MRDASRGYLDPAKFPNAREGSALDIWKTQNNQQSVNMFTVKVLSPVTDNDVKELLSDVFMVIVPEQNIEGYEHMTRTTGQGYDPNRDEANQTLFEDSNAMALVNKFNPMVFTEIHGRVDAMLIEPCTPPHEPNFEYDLIAEQFVKLGEAVGMGAIANNSEHNSFEMPYRDFLKKSSTSPSGAEWSSPWDDMTTAYDKEKAIYDWMTSKLNYDTGVLQVIPQTSADCDNPYGVLKYHNAVCVGYATTFRLFMQMLDIPCMVVHNTEKYHSWDLVQLDGDWYHVDIYSDQNGSSYANFNMNDELAGQTHDWDRDFFPAATSLKYNYGYQNKQPVKDIYSIPKMIRQALEDKQGCLFLDFETIDEEHAQIVEAMLSGVQSSMNMHPDYEMMWSNWTWIHVTGNEYVLAYFLQGYDNEEQPGIELSDEEQTKVEDAVNSVFGEDVDWATIQEELENHNDTSSSATVDTAEG